MTDETTGPDDALLTATNHDGEQLWASPFDGRSIVLARMAGIVVVGDDDRVVGLDADGTRLLRGITGDGDAGRLVAVGGHPLLISTSWSTARGLG